MRNYTVPFFEVLQCAQRINGTKLNYIKDDNGIYIPLAMAKNKKWVWMEQLAYRVARRYKIPVAFATQLENKIIDKYGRSNGFNLPSAITHIGFFEMHDGKLSATGCGIDDDAILMAARFRDERLHFLLRRKNKISGEVLTAWIIQVELGELINGREKAARKQSRIRGQQGNSTSQHGGNDRPTFPNNGACG